MNNLLGRIEMVLFQKSNTCLEDSWKLEINYISVLSTVTTFLLLFSQINLEFLFGYLLEVWPSGLKKIFGCKILFKFCNLTNWYVDNKFHNPFHVCVLENLFQIICESTFFTLFFCSLYLYMNFLIMSHILSSLQEFLRILFFFEISSEFCQINLNSSIPFFHIKHKMRTFLILRQYFLI
jgi:hypothetical protein